jgi:hypothetical protein
MRLTNIPMLSRPARTGDLSKAILNSTDQRPQNPAACPGGSSVITGPHPDVGPRSRPIAGLIMGTGSQCRGVPPDRHFNAASGRPIGVSRRLPRRHSGEMASVGERTDRVARLGFNRASGRTPLTHWTIEELRPGQRLHLIRDGATLCASR